MVSSCRRSFTLALVAVPDGNRMGFRVGVKNRLALGCAETGIAAGKSNSQTKIFDEIPFLPQASNDVGQMFWAILAAPAPSLAKALPFHAFRLDPRPDLCTCHNAAPATTSTQELKN